VTTVYQQKGLDYFGILEASLQNRLSISPRFGGYFEIPEESYDQSRKQYEPRRIIEKLLGLNGHPNQFRVGVVDVDIYVRGMNFIFGLAQPLRRAAIVSVHRLGGPRLHERLAKEVVHETGHLFGLEHCLDPGCVMYFSNTIEETDQKRENLCAECRRKIEK
jgi:archaemetzincin